MGQYYYIVNPKKREYLDPMGFDDGSKLLEFTSGRYGACAALAILTSNGNGQGGGDLEVPEGTPGEDLVGSWAGDPVVTAGDYGDNLRWVTKRAVSQYRRAYRLDIRDTFRKYVAAGKTEFANVTPAQWLERELERYNKYSRTPNLYDVAKYTYADVTARIRGVMLASGVPVTPLPGDKPVKTRKTRRATRSRSA